MRIAIIGSRENAVRAYQMALKLAQASQYFGNEFYHEERGIQLFPEPSKKVRIPKGCRYTRAIPAPAMLKRFPNWMFALDEEGRPGQDETTLRPDDNQEYVSDFTAAAASDATLPNGKTCTALLVSSFLLCNGVEFVHVYEGRNTWTVEIWEGRWKPNTAMTGHTRQLGDRNSFPLRVVTRLRCGATGEQLAVTLFPDGRAEESGGFAEPSLLSQVLAHVEKGERETGGNKKK